jgi:hypothetical protein
LCPSGASADGHNDDVSGSGFAVPQGKRPSLAVSCKGANLVDLQVSAHAEDDLCKRFDDALRPVEITVIGAVGRTRESVRVERRHELGCLGRSQEARRNTHGVLDPHVLAQALNGLFAIGNEDVTATVESSLCASAISLGEVAVERERLLCHQAVRPCAPLLAHSTRLDSGRSCADSTALEERHIDAPLA